MSATTTLIGRLVKDIEIKTSEKNKPYGLLRLAVRRTYKSKDGEYVTDFYSMPVFNEQQIKNIKQYTTKGSLLAVHGNLQTNIISENDKNRTYINIIPENFIFLSNPKNHSNLSQDLNLDNPERQNIETASIEVEELEEIYIQNEIDNFNINNINQDEHPFY